MTAAVLFAGMAGAAKQWQGDGVTPGRVRMLAAIRGLAKVS